MISKRERFDLMIGRLDRLLSEFLVEAYFSQNLDLADFQTVKHHADDLIGVGQKALKLLDLREEKRDGNSQRAVSQQRKPSTTSKSKQGRNRRVSHKKP